MIYVIPEEIIKSASMCLRGHACLYDPEYKLCGEICYRDTRMIRLLCPKELECTFTRQIGKVTVCTCPVRQEIYRNYET